MFANIDPLCVLLSRPSVTGSIRSMGSLDWRVVSAGALLAALIAVPAALISRGSGVDEDSPWMPLFFGIVLIGFALGGALAARAATHLPLTHAAAGAFMAFAVVQVVGIIRRLIVGDDINLASIVFAGLLSLSAGMVGGLIALRVKQRQAG